MSYPRKYGSKAHNKGHTKERFATNRSRKIFQNNNIPSFLGWQVVLNLDLNLITLCQ